MKRLIKLVITNLRIFERARLRWILFSLNNHPTLIANIKQPLHDVVIVNHAIARHCEYTPKNTIEEGIRIRIDVFKNVAADILGMKMVDSAAVFGDDRPIIAASKDKMTCIQQQTNRLASGIHNSIKLGLCLDCRSHMMVEAQRHTLAGTMFGQRCQPAAIGDDVVVIQFRTAGKRALLPVLDRLVCLAINDDRGTDSLEQSQLVGDALQL